MQRHTTGLGGCSRYEVTLSVASSGVRVRVLMSFHRKSCSQAFVFIRGVRQSSSQHTLWLNSATSVPTAHVQEALHIAYTFVGT